MYCDGRAARSVAPATHVMLHKVSYRPRGQVQRILAARPGRQEFPAFFTFADHLKLMNTGATILRSSVYTPAV